MNLYSRIFAALLLAAVFTVYARDAETEVLNEVDAPLGSEEEPAEPDLQVEPRAGLLEDRETPESSAEESLPAGPMIEPGEEETDADTDTDAAPAPEGEEEFEPVLSPFQIKLRVGHRYRSGGENEKAVEAYRAALELQPDSFSARFGLATVYAETGEYEKAERMFRELLAERPHDYRLMNNLGWIYATAEDPEVRDGDRAVRYGLKALMEAPDDFHVWSTLAEARLMKGEYTKAVASARQAFTLARMQTKDEEQIKYYYSQLQKCRHALNAKEFLEQPGDANPEPEIDAEPETAPQTVLP
ncbi:tetratricopeptide repeat protein [Kiritimatiella glycovorans]|uniref:Putative PEP-CTERM system TPR-repeat lipoprotein n=1 Tax=Kiritimatiella glycovorans TaxID=1307763 RepID=A0A0G3EG94_9BACT|nr:tetratricopeptide repeat protein [Kiritimatiella glycovorans]AKJ65358.1 putative PEP-CTERM system TPR-repeat lipoprotein [Kiritimatiella glycovorans]